MMDVRTCFESLECLQYFGTDSILVCFPNISFTDIGSSLVQHCLWSSVHLLMQYSFPVLVLYLIPEIN